MTKVVHIQWKDAAGLEQWHDHAEFKAFCDTDLSHVDSIGILGFENEEKIVLIQTASANQVSGLFEIPKGCIKQMKVIAKLPIRFEL
jgi:hypothetical protein